MAQASRDDGRRLAIRKYPNRRYYNATRSRHVTLEEIHALIRDGYEVEVTDSKSGEDLTAKVLTQIVLEMDSPKLQIFPAALLHRLIRDNEELVREFVDKYFTQALTAFLDSQRQFESYLRRTFALQAPMFVAPDWANMVLGPFAKQLRPAPVAQPEWSDPPSGDTPDDRQGLRAEIEELRRQVRTLQDQLSQRKGDADE